MTGWTDVIVAVGGLITAFGGATGIRALLKRRRPTSQDNFIQLSEGTIRWATALEESTARALSRATEAEAKADEADRRCDLAERHARRIEHQLAEVVSYLDMVLRAINDPGMSMERLRRLTAEGPPQVP